MNTDGKAFTQNEEFDLVNSGFSGILITFRNFIVLVRTLALVISSIFCVMLHSFTSPLSLD